VINESGLVGTTARSEVLRLNLLGGAIRLGCKFLRSLVSSGQSYDSSTPSKIPTTRTSVKIHAG